VREADVVVVGAGPGGVAAALEAAEAGAAVVLVDEGPTPGGQFYRQVPEPFRIRRPRAEGPRYAAGAALLRRLRASGVDRLPDSLVWSIFQDGTLGILREGRAEELRGRRLILAPGAQERPVAFPGWTLPGVMMGGAAQALLVAQRVLPGRRVLLAGVGPLQLQLASRLTRAGAAVLEILEASAALPTSAANLLRGLGHWGKLWEGAGYWLDLKRSGTPYRPRHVPVRALGGERLEAVVVAEVDGEGRVRPGTERTLEADTLCLSYGFLPAVQLPRLLGCRVVYDEAAGGWSTCHDAEQQTSLPNVYVAGEVGGIGGAEVALEEGRLAGLAACRSLGKGRGDHPERERRCRRRLARGRAFARLAAGMMRVPPALFELITDDTIICRCENVTARQLLDAIGPAGEESLRGVKIQTRAGMGLCQGRMCGHLIPRLIASRTGRPLDSIQPDTPQAPIRPIPLRAMAAPAG